MASSNSGDAAPGASQGSGAPGTAAGGVGSGTKSIMNTSGTSGAVVSNTPEPGLKRTPTVTFSDARTGTGVNSGANSSHEDLIAAERDSRLGNGAGNVQRSVSPSSILSVSSAGMSPKNLPSAVAQALANVALSDERSPPAGGPASHEAKSQARFAMDDRLHKISGASVSERELKPIQTFTEPQILESVMENGKTTVPKRDFSKNTDPRLPQDDGKIHVLFGATGSPSVFKLRTMVKKLEDIYGKDKISIQVILTEAAMRFFAKRSSKKTKTFDAGLLSATELSFNPVSSLNSGKLVTPSSATPPLGMNCQSPNLCIDLPPDVRYWTDSDEWESWKQRTDPVLHIELRRWADILVVAPLTANTLSKLTLGLCDNLLTSVIRAWNPNFPILLAPAMVSSTFNSAMTKKQLNIIKDEMPWITVFKPSEKVIGINGDIGLGGMMDPNEIVDKIVMKLGLPAITDEEEAEEDDEDEDEDEDKNEDDEDGDDEDGDDEDEDDEDEDDDDDDDDDADDEDPIAQNS